MPAIESSQSSLTDTEAVVTAAGRSFKLEFPSADDHIANTIRRTGSFYEAEMLADLRSRLFFPKSAADVGAHVGNHTLFFAGVLGMRTVAFEPHPSHFPLLQANVAANDLAELCSLQNVAVGARPSRARIVDENDKNSGMARIEDAADGSVAVVTLDAILADVAVLDLLKIDVEGSELAVLEGASTTIHRLRPLAYIEITPVNFAAARDFFEQHQYVCWKQFNATPTFLFMPAERFRA